MMQRPRWSLSRLRWLSNVQDESKERAKASPLGVLGAFAMTVGLGIFLIGVFKACDDRNEQLPERSGRIISRDAGRPPTAIAGVALWGSGSVSRIRASARRSPSSCRRGAAPSPSGSSAPCTDHLVLGQQHPRTAVPGVLVVLVIVSVVPRPLALPLLIPVTRSVGRGKGVRSSRPYRGMVHPSLEAMVSRLPHGDSLCSSGLAQPRIPTIAASE